MMHPSDTEFSGFHQFRKDDGSLCGSFEVFYEDGSDPLLKRGWYWWHRHHGYVAESDQEGPFPNAEGACIDALEGHHSATMPGNGWVMKGGDAMVEDLDDYIKELSVDTALEEGTRFERLFDGNDVGG
jgi:hypothetical protein